VGIKHGDQCKSRICLIASGISWETEKGREKGGCLTLELIFKNEMNFRTVYKQVF
jgi:hypothetical protein